MTVLDFAVVFDRKQNLNKLANVRSAQHVWCVSCLVTLIPIVSVVREYFQCSPNARATFFLGALSNLQKATVSVIMEACLCSYACSNRTTRTFLDRFS